VDLPTLHGERVTLRKLTADDIERLLPAVYEPGIAEWWGDTSDADYQREGFENEGKAFAIDLGDELAGWLCFHEETEPDYPSVTFDILLLPAFQGQGLGPEALRALIRWFIDERGHHFFMIDPAAENHRAIAAYKAAGFRPVGILRKQERAPDGRWRDSLLMDLLAEDLDRPQPASIRRDSTAATGSIVISQLDRSDLDTLEPLWAALNDHHAEITPMLNGAPARDRAESWQRRKGKYEKWLTDPATFILVASRDDQPVGYACVTVGPGFASWASGDRIAELETLSVLPHERGNGVGTALVDAVEDHLRAAGITDMTVTSATTNTDSHRFYERRGIHKAFSVFYGSIAEGTDQS